MKCEASQEFVVGGFTDPQGARVGLGALLVGYYEGDDFVFAGKVGTGFDTKLLLDLRARLDAIEIAEVAVHQSHGPAAPARALGASGDRRAGRVHRVDRARQAAPSAAARRPRSTRTPRDVVTRDSRDHASREGAVPGRRDHQGRAGGVLRSDRAGHAAAPARAAGHDGALPGRHRQEGLLAEGRLEGLSRRGCERVEVPKKDGVVHHPLVTDTRSLLWITNQNTITQHVWTSRAPELYHPDICVFDLDPSEDDAASGARGGARRCATCSKSSACRRWVKTTGSKGFHIVVPLDGKTRHGRGRALRARGRARCS